MFFAFESKSGCIAHMDWLKGRIDSLEKYRTGKISFGENYYTKF